MAAQDLSDKLVVMGVSTEAANLIEANFNNYPAKDANGNISANVNLRSGTLNSLMALAGGTSEIGYATDTNALVRFNGNAGQAQVLNNNAVLNFKFTNANIAQYTTGTSFIDCNNISVLNIDFDPSVATRINNINVKFPLSDKIQNFTVNLLTVGQGTNFNTTITITPAYQAGDPNNGYFSIDADGLGDGLNPNVNVAQAIFSVSIKFFTGLNIGAWSRIPCYELAEGGSNVYSMHPVETGVGYTHPDTNSTTATYALTNNVVKNLGSWTAPVGGVWMMLGKVRFTTSTNLVASQIIASAVESDATTAPSGGSCIISSINQPSGTIMEFALPPTIILPVKADTYYYNVKATFNTGVGTISALMFARAIKLL